jgi:hypothetical protein
LDPLWYCSFPLFQWNFHCLFLCCYTSYSHLLYKSSLVANCQFTHH